MTIMINRNNFLSIYNQCDLCPRDCKVDRNIHQGFCSETSKLSVATVLLHHGEEPPITFENGSGTVFFSGCSLRCPYCQNMQISQPMQNEWMELNKFTLAEFVKLLENLVQKGAENINFVTPDHFLPHILEAVKALKQNGCQIPFVYNCSGYINRKYLALLCEHIDIFLIDYKYSDKNLAGLLSQTPDYPEITLQALQYIYKQKGNLHLDKKGKAVKGMLIRHLVLPGFISNSLIVLKSLYENFGREIFFSLMAQYTQKFLKSNLPVELKTLNRRLTNAEYEKVLNYVYEKDFINGYVQEIPDQKDHYVPDFSEKQLFDKW